MLLIDDETHFRNGIEAAIRDQLTVLPEMERYIDCAVMVIDFTRSLGAHKNKYQISGQKASGELDELAKHLQAAADALRGLSPGTRRSLMDAERRLYAIGRKPEDEWDTTGGITSPWVSGDLSGWAQEALSAKEMLADYGPPASKGRPRDMAATKLASWVLDSYEVLTGKPGTVITDPHATGYPRRGEFLDFLKQIFAVCGIKASPDSQAKAAIKARKGLPARERYVADRLLKLRDRL